MPYQILRLLRFLTTDSVLIKHIYLTWSVLRALKTVLIVTLLKVRVLHVLTTVMFFKTPYATLVSSTLRTVPLAVINQLAYLVLIFTTFLPISANYVISMESVKNVFLKPIVQNVTPSKGMKRIQWIQLVCVNKIIHFLTRSA